MSIEKRTCSLEGCAKPYSARGWCHMHYGRWRRHGDPLAHPRLPAEQRFWMRVVQGDGCWSWGGKLHPDGYGELSVDGRRMLAHRFAYQLLVGPIPEGRFVLHHCDNPPCCKPEHLYVGDQIDNVRDKVIRGRCYSRLTRADADAIRSRYPAEMGKDLAQEYGVSKSLVSLIVQGRIWRPLDHPAP